MSTSSHPVRRSAHVRRARDVRAAARRRVVRRRVAAVIGVAIGLAVTASLAVPPVFRDTLKEIALPLRHEDIIRQQARDKGLDPALIAAVIYAESRFRDGQTSTAGAQGLMQITPATARFIARESGGVAFTVQDLATPQVNISYGAFYLRYLLRRYGDNEIFALAAYNGGEGNVDRWIVEARNRDEDLSVDAIPFPETRAYVSQVRSTRDDYRRAHADALGL